MIIVMRRGASEQDLECVVARIEKLGFKPHISQGVERTVIGAIGDERNKPQLEAMRNMHGVDNVVPILKPFKLVSRELRGQSSEIDVDGVVFGVPEIQMIAGPCSVESREQILEVAEDIKKSGAKFLRGGAYKPRTSPYSFQGLEEAGLKLLAEAREATGLKIVTEVMDSYTVSLVAEYADIVQIGARNMQNFSLLKSIGKIDKPILLKRGMMSTVEEFLMSAEYILSEGNERVILCERGIRTFETCTRNTLDLSAIPVIKELSHLPVVVDPSHAVGKWSLVSSMARASVAAGADGLMIEVHPRPGEAFSDGYQSLTPENFERLMRELGPFASAAGRTLAGIL